MVQTVVQTQVPADNLPALAMLIKVHDVKASLIVVCYETAVFLMPGQAVADGQFQVITGVWYHQDHAQAMMTWNECIGDLSRCTKNDSLFKRKTIASNRFFPSNGPYMGTVIDRKIQEIVRADTEFCRRLKSFANESIHEYYVLSDRGKLADRTPK